MTRPCFLVIDREHAGNISTRKLVIETAKLNVITAYSGAEAIATLARFPAVDGVVLDAGIKDMPCAQLVAGLKVTAPGVPLILIGFPREGSCPGADHELETFEPMRLLTLLQSLVPREADEVKREDQRLQETE